jgi:hypothetical protein
MKSTTEAILLGIAKFYRSRGYITQKQKIIVDFNVVGGFTVFRNLVNDCDLIEHLEVKKWLT